MEPAEGSVLAIMSLAVAIMRLLWAFGIRPSDDAKMLLGYR